MKAMNHSHHQGSASGTATPINRVREVRLLQRVSIRTIARQLSLTIKEAMALENPTNDLPISTLRQLADIICVPVGELVEEPSGALATPVADRAAMIRVMKTVKALQEKLPAANKQLQWLTQTLIDQLLNLMPELAEVSAMHSVGHRKTLDDLGRVAENPIAVPYSVLSKIDEFPLSHKGVKG